MTSMNSVLETRALIRSRLGAPDVYPQDPKQKEDELTSTSVKIGFTYSIPGIGENIEYGSAARCHIDTNKLNDSFNEILWHKQKKNTYPDIANSVNKKRPGLTKENFFLVQLTKNRGYVSQWIKDLKNGKALSHIAKRVPIYGKKEEIFQALAEQQVAIVRASWFIKMTAQYFVLQADAKNKKNRTTVDHNPEWTTAICRFMKEQLSRLLDDQSLNHPGMLGIQHVLDETERHYEYMSKLANYMYAEGMLDRHDFLSWIVETMERMRAHGTHALTYIMPLVMKHVQDIVKNQLLSRRLAFVCCRLLSWLLNDSTWGSNTNRSNAIESPSPLSVGPPSVSGPQSQKQLSAPPTPGQMSKPLSPPKLGQNMNSANMAPRALPTNFPTFLEDIAYGLICIVQCITMDCPGALVWYPPEDTNRVPGSPLDYLPVAPSLLPLPSKSEKSSTSEDAALRSKLHEMQNDIIQRSYAAEMRWSSDKCQESVTGQAINRLLSTLEVLDKQQNFDRTEPIDSIYYKIFAHSNSSKDGNDQVSQTGDEAVICLLCEWAVSAQRLGEHRAAVVAKLLDKRQALLEQEQAIAAAEKAKVLNTSNPTTSSSNPGSVGTILSPPQLLVEGTEPLHNEQAINQPLAASGIAPNNIPIFQELLFNFLDTQAPELVDPFNKKELQSFKNLVMLFSELVQHDVFSHDEYVNTLISKGEITPGVISPLPIFNQASTSSATLNASTGYNNHSSVGAISIPSVEPRSVGAPVSNRAMDLMAKTDFDDDFPSSARSIDHKTDGDLMCSPTVSPFGTSMTERHFTDVMKSMPDNSKDKMPLLSSSGYYKKVVGPIWGYGQRRHVQYLMHLPIPFEDDDCVHEMNQRMMVLYGAARQRTEVKKEVKKISKYVCKLIQKPPSLDNNYTGPSSVKSSSGSSSKKSKNRNSDAFSTNQSSTNVLLKRFRCLTYFDQHFVTAQASKAVLSSFTEYIEENSFHLPPLSSITLVLSLMEEALNVSGMVQLSVRIAGMLNSLGREICKKNPEKGICYTKDLVLNIVAILRHYQSYLMLDPELTRQTFDILFAFIKHSNVVNPSDCTSSDRCVLMFLYDLFTSFRKYLLESQINKFSSYSSLIKQALCQSKIAAASSRSFNENFMLDFIQRPERLKETHPLVVAKQARRMLDDETYKYTFVCSALRTVCSGQHTPESLSALAILCAEMNAQCNDLSSEWLGVLKVLCSGSGSHSGIFTDVFLCVDPADETIRDPLALFTAILIARNCLSMENFIREVAIPPLLAACKQPIVDGSEVETGARLTCHILLQLFKTPVLPSQATTSDFSRQDKQQFYIPEACHRHLLAAAQRNIVVGAVLAVVKLILKLGDASFSGKHSSSPSNNEPGVTSFLAPIPSLDDMSSNFGLLGQSRSVTNNCSFDTPCLSEFAKAAVRTICSQQWVRERCLKNIDWDLWMDKEITRGQMQNLIQYIFCPQEDIQQLSNGPHDQRRYVVQVLNRMSRWTLRQTLLELQIMLKQASQDEILSDDIAKAVIEVFKNHNTEPAKDRKSPIFGIELDESNIWLMPHLIKELSSEVQTKVLQEASRILETSQQHSRGKSDRSSTKNPASLLSQQPFLSLILTCLKKEDDSSVIPALLRKYPAPRLHNSNILLGAVKMTCQMKRRTVGLDEKSPIDQNNQRYALLDSLQSQILMFHSEWHQHQKETSLKDSVMSQAVIQESLQLRLNLMGGIFHTVQNSSHNTSSVVVLLTQLISSGMVNVEVNAKLFNTVYDMIAVLLHGTLGGDSPNGGEGSKKDYLAIVKKIKKEICDAKSTSLNILRRLLPVPRKETFVMTCEQSPGNCGFQISSKQKIIPWDIIEGLKTSAPLCLPWYGICKTERREITYETQRRLLLFHDHDSYKLPLSDCLKPPTLPPEEEEEKEEVPKNPRKRPSTNISRKNSTTGGTAPYRDILVPPKRAKAEKASKVKRVRKSQDFTPLPRPMPGSYNTALGQTSMNVMSMPPTQPMRTHQSYSNNPHSYQANYPSHGNAVMPPSHMIAANTGKGAQGHSRESLIRYLQSRSASNQGMHSSNPISLGPNSKAALRNMFDRKTSHPQNDMGSYAPRHGNTPVGHMSSTMPINNIQQHRQPSGYNNYAHQNTTNVNQMHMKNPNYNYQGVVSNQQQSYQQTIPNQSFMNQPQTNTNMASGYQMGNIQMHNRGMNQPSGYGMSAGMQVPNQSNMMGSHQPPQYSGIMNQQTRTINRMTPQRHINTGGGQSQMMQMGIAGGQSTMNTVMGRPNQMVNQGMGSQYVQSRGTELTDNMRRPMPNPGGMYN